MEKNDFYRTRLKENFAKMGIKNLVESSLIFATKKKVHKFRSFETLGKRSNP